MTLQRRLLLLVLVTTFSLVLSFLQASSPVDGVYAVQPFLRIDPYKMLQILSLPVQVYFHQVFTSLQWLFLFIPVLSILSLMALAFFAFLFRKHTCVLLIYLSGNLALLTFFYVFYSGSVWHHGHFLVLLMAGYWIMLVSATHRDKHRMTSVIGKVTLGIILLLQIQQAAYVFEHDLRRPFSNGKAVADHIRAQHWQDEVILSDTFWKAVTVSGYLDRPIYHGKQRGFRTYAVWQHVQRPQSLSDLMDDQPSLLKYPGQKAVLILDHRLDDQTIRNYQLQPAGEFTQSMTDEDYYLYVK